uniref:Uncharacterized protein n=1 Tax=Rhizophagus irregularis (strain DAOM 181602 / DAOM 197198 / MUCL 43194) TaxID=747089 RepID=U9T4J4_RHIID
MKMVKGEFLYRDGHLKRCIVSKANPIEHARKKEILQSIDRREFNIWQYKQYILQEEAKINRLQLELSSQSISHSEKDKLASISYDYDSRTIGYETYKQDKMTIAENIMPSAPSFKPACISVTSGNQEMISPNSYQSSNCKSDTGEIFISSQYAKQPKGTMLRLRDGRELQEETRIFGKTSLEGEFNWKVDHFYSQYSHILYSTRTWAEEKQNQLACRLNWLSFELVKKLLQQEGYVLLYGTFEWPIMIKWTQNPKYYLDTEENRNSRHFVRKDMLGPHDIKSIESHSRLTSDWWYKHKA